MKSYIVYSSDQDVTTIWGVVTDKRVLQKVKKESGRKLFESHQEFGTDEDKTEYDFLNQIKVKELDPNKATSGIDIFHN